MFYYIIYQTLKPTLYHTLDGWLLNQTFPTLTAKNFWNMRNDNNVF